MKIKLTRVISIAISLFVAMYFGYQIYLLLYTPYDTEIAMLYHYTDQVDLQGVAVKEEEIIENEMDGIVKYEHSNSQKIGAGSVVATVFSSEKDLVNHSLLEEKQSYLSLLNTLEEKRVSIQNNTQSLTPTIKNNQLALLSKMKNNDYGDISQLELRFSESYLKQQMMLDPEIRFTDKITALKEEIADIQGKISVASEIIKTPTTGYFTAEVDGYESIFTADILTDLSADTIKNLLENSTEEDHSNAIGKIITSSEWKFVSIVKTSEADRFIKGKTVELAFSDAADYTIPGMVEEIRLEKDREYSTVVFNCNVMNENMINLRKERPTAIFDTGTGLRVSNSALRVKEIEEEQEDGSTKVVAQTGVYINMGQVVRFKKVDVIYESEDYVICSLKADTDYLQLYDEIILEGNDLYDNKPIR